MTELDDHQLLADFTRSESEAAFAALVKRHVNLVYSAAWRFTGNPHHAQEITQAVFIILARKAGKMSPRILLTGWLYQTARLTAANFVKGEIRRQQREQEAYMQSTLNEADTAAWQQIAPLLDEAMGRLGETDRNAILLRFFENKTAQEVGATLKLNEAAAHKRTERALEKLRKFFTKRGVSLSATLIAGAVSTNSVQAAPLGLSATVTAAAAKGAAVSASTLTLIKGALKIMAWTKAKMALVVGVGVLLAAGTSTVVVEKCVTRMNSILTQRLEDGSMLILNRISFGDKGEFGYGGRTNSWSDPGHDRLAMEFRLISKDGANFPLVKPAFNRQFRCMVRGEEGMEYVEEFYPNEFKYDSGDYYGYITTRIFPRDSKWLWFRVEKSETNKPYGPWQTVAEFKTANPTHSAKRTWFARSAPTTNTVAGMNFVLGEVTVELRADNPRDIWNHVVTVPIQVFDGGVPLTNWGAMYVHMEDASGNWNPILQSHRSLDPRYVWKLDMDFEPVSGFADENLATIQLPTGRRTSVTTMTTNITGVPVTISWDGNWIAASIPTNHPNLALEFVKANDDQSEMKDGSGSWDQYQFRKGNFMSRRGNMLILGGKPTKVTVAVVPNVHTTFYAQPKLVIEKVK
jgi:RNA polymerase sigma factor (sigma-70 family)